MQQVAVTRTTQDDVRNSIFPGKSDEGAGYVLVFERDDQAAHLLGCFQRIGDMTLRGGIDANCGFLGCADVNRVPLRVELCSQARRLTQKAARVGAKAAYRHHDLPQSADTLV